MSIFLPPNGDGSATLDDFAYQSQAVYVRLRHAGRSRGQAWLIASAIRSELPRWIKAAASSADATLELTQIRSDVPAQPVDETCLSNQQRGLLAFTDDPYDPQRWLAPNDVITSNRAHPKALQRSFGLGSPTAAPVLAYATRQWLYLAKSSPSWVALQRQKAPAGTRDVDSRGLAQLREGLADWLYAQAGDDGFTPYKYWPGNGRYSPADNSVRRFFGVFAMRQHAWQQGSVDRRQSAERCLERLLSERYESYEGFGLILDTRGVKLGAVAVAGLALLAGPTRSLDQLAALYRTTRRLAQRDGAFRTFWWPRDRNDNQNFYPGEALYFWTRLYRAFPDAELRCLIDRGLHYYQRRHRDRPNPAFVPWHTLALSTMYDTTGNDGYLDDLAAMNDWLLPLQQWDSAPHPDMRGRFFDPMRPDFGPPHASSTAVYCESLMTAAGSLAKAGMQTRAEPLSCAARRGFSHLRQLQYLDRTDLFRFAHPERVRGALRTEVYDLTVRVDSVAHALQACLAWDAAGMPADDQEQSPR